MAERGNTRMMMASTKSTISATDESMQANLRMGETLQKKMVQDIITTEGNLGDEVYFCHGDSSHSARELMVS